MKPISLDLLNYRSFAHVQMELGDCTAVSVVGQNGAGKSTLIEAFTWALYGDSRSAGVDGPVRLGQTECSVAFTFEHDCNVYKVIRKRVRDKKSELHLMRSVGVGIEADWEVVTCASMRETQEAINNLLQMDRTLWGASAYIMQGESAGICEATPAERKKTLSIILADKLKRFGSLHERAKQKVVTVDHRVLSLDAVINSNSELLVGTFGYTEELEECKANIAGAKTANEKHEERRNELQTELAMVQATNDTGRKIETDLLGLKSQYAAMERDIIRMEESISAAKATIGNADFIRANVARLEVIEKQVSELRDIKDKHTSFEMMHNQKRATLDKAISDCNYALSTLKTVREQTAEKQQNYLTWKSLVDGVPCMSDDAMVSVCAVRNQALKAVRTDYTDDLEKADQAIYEAEEALVAAIESKECSDLDYAEAVRILPEFDQNTLSSLQQEIVGLGTARSKLTASVNSEHEIERLNDRLDDAYKAKGGMEDQLAKLDEQFKDWVFIDATELVHFINDALGEIKVNNTIISECERRIGTLEEKLNQAEAARTAITAAENEKESLAVTRETLVALVQAFGRDGIPALVIDAVVPEIEQVANENLSILSNGTMNLHFITQKFKADNGVAETLDIIISDESGERPYEDWSGGERLRIDLAVRWALMRLLANRNGAECKMMLLDEVCAPLDDAGEDALIECINLISQHIMVFLITHRESLKERLPQQINIRRTNEESGSDAVLTL